jgi:hypothetical protein
MNILSIIIGLVALSGFGYFALKEGLHKETGTERMIRLTQPTLAKKIPKWYAIILGLFCWGAVIYFAIKFFLLPLI